MLAKTTKPISARRGGAAVFNSGWRGGSSLVEFQAGFARFSLVLDSEPPVLSAKY
jgi:hypothetical protein